MQLSYILFTLFFALTFCSCSVKTTSTTNIINRIDSAYNVGDFNLATSLINSYPRNAGIDSLKRIAEMERKLDMISRIRIEFSLTGEDVRKRLLPYFPHITDVQIEKWEADGLLEMRVIDGEKRYFKRAVSNLFLLDSVARAVKVAKDGLPDDMVARFQQRYLCQLFAKGKPVESKPFDFRKMRLHYSITLQPNAVPSGEKVRCWMPFPVSDSLRQSAYKIVSTSDPCIISPVTQSQRTIYMEKAACADSATIFDMVLDIETAAVWFNPDPSMVKPYDKTKPQYALYTAERTPHIVLSNEVRHLAREIVGNETNPLEQVRLLFYWLNNNVPWAGALEYSVMESIPAYVLQNHRGDCGMQTFLFISMARSLGIPARWESGWYLLPEEINLHDWAQVYFEGIGWVPVDPSFKLVEHSDKRIREFYIGGIDSYRFIVNTDYAQTLYPGKHYPRSEPIDFQRGELEWIGGNLYFDKWSYNMQVDWVD